MAHLTSDLRAFATANDVNGTVMISHEELDILLDRIDRAHHDEVELYYDKGFDDCAKRPVPLPDDDDGLNVITHEEMDTFLDNTYVNGYDKGLEDAKNHALETMIFLPLDADGEPIHVNDTMDYGIVMEMALENDGTWYITLDGDGIWDGTWEPKDLRHLNIDDSADILETYHRIMSRPCMENNPQIRLDSITGHFVKLINNCKKEN